MEIASTYVIVPLISGAFNVLIDRLASDNTKRLLMGYDSTVDELSKLKTTMEVVNGMVNGIDPATHVMRDPDPTLKNLLNNIKNDVYDSEDLLEQILTKPRRSPSTRRGVVSRLSPFHGRIVGIQEMNQRFREYSEYLSKFVTTKTNPQQTPYILMNSIETSSLVDESIIFGRDSEREQIFKVLEDGVPRVHRRLLRGKDIVKGPVIAENVIRVIAIVGIPGIGKTTLAQVVFNDPRVDNIFNLKVWVYVPKVFDAAQIISKILSLMLESSHPKLSISKMINTLEHNTLEEKQKILRKEVAAKRIMIVLDDLRDGDNLNDTWQNLLNSLKPAAPGSTIIVTTGSEIVARVLHPILTLPLHLLSDHDAWDLFQKHAVGSSDTRLESLGFEIMKKGGGLPLAIVALGRLLVHIASDVNEWQNIASSKLWDLSAFKKENIALLLCYNYLPEPVKRCFAYCSIFPKNYQFDKQNLVLLWMAEGFIQKPMSDFSRTLEDIGKDYFDALKSHYFFQVSNSVRDCFVMHDLIHELAVYVMGEFGSMLEPNNLDTPKEMLRHLSYKQSKYDTAEKFRVIARDRLRTFFPVGSETFSTAMSGSYVTNSVLQSLKQFGCLRVLSLRGYKITNIPPSIGSLQLLRYLDFSFTCIEELPESICDLSNLQTLLLRHCHRLRKLPAMTRKLVDLRHLDIHGTKRLQEMPNNIGSLICLQTLTDFVVGEHNRNSIRELGQFTQLRGSLRISGLHNVINEADACAADLRSKARLYELVLSTSVRVGLEMQFDGGAVLNEQLEKNLDALMPHTNLRRLTIDHYGGYGFPDWVGDEAFCNLKVLRLVDSSNCTTLPSLGHLPSLKHLLVECFEKLETVGPEFYGQSSSPFKSLVTLEFKSLFRWKTWIDCDIAVDSFRCLEKLTLWSCNNLEGRIPFSLPSLVDLDVSDCRKLHCLLPYSTELRKLRLVNVGRLDLRDLAGFTCLTELTLCNFHSVADADTVIANAKNVLPHMTSLENLTLRLYAYHGGSNTDPEGSWNLPSSIRSITVDGECIKQFGAFIEGCTHIQYLCVNRHGSLIQFPPGHSQVLNHLDFDCCDKLGESLILATGDDLGFKSLYDLSVSSFRNVELRFLARNLTTLSLSACWNLRSLPDGMAARFPCLQFLSIRGCPLSETFPDDDLPPNLQTLQLECCGELQFLSEKISICTSLQRLSISECPSLESLPAIGLPPDLRLLSVNHCEGLSWNYAAWQLNKLTSLQELQIMHDEHVEFFPANGSLPNSLIMLHIKGFRNLRSVNCRELRGIPSLREVEISDCHNLLSFAGGDLPQSLCRLSILGSPLAARWSKPDWWGRYIKKTSHITCLDLSVKALTWTERIIGMQ